MWSNEKWKVKFVKIFPAVERESRVYQEKQKRIKRVPRESIENKTRIKRSKREWNANQENQ